MKKLNFYITPKFFRRKIILFNLIFDNYFSMNEFIHGDISFETTALKSN